MTSVTRDRITLGVAVAAPAGMVLWMLATQTAAVPSTWVFVALLTIALGVIGFNTWHNSRATGSMAQVIHETDVTPVAAAAPANDQTPGPR